MDGKLPVHQYEVWIKKDLFACPGYKRAPVIKHKHIAIVNTWINSGSPDSSLLNLLTTNQPYPHTLWDQLMSIETWFTRVLSIPANQLKQRLIWNVRNIVYSSGLEPARKSQ